jgi:hypothetical protein
MTMMSLKLRKHDDDDHLCSTPSLSILSSLHVEGTGMPARLEGGSITWRSMTVREIERIPGYGRFFHRTVKKAQLTLK